MEVDVKLLLVYISDKGMQTNTLFLLGCQPNNKPLNLWAASIVLEHCIFK